MEAINNINTDTASSIPNNVLCFFKAWGTEVVSNFRDKTFEPLRANFTVAAGDGNCQLALVRGKQKQQPTRTFNLICDAGLYFISS